MAVNAEDLCVRGRAVWESTKWILVCVKLSERKPSDSTKMDLKKRKMTMKSIILG